MFPCMHTVLTKSNIDIDLGNTSHINEFTVKGKEWHFPPIEINQLAFCCKVVPVGLNLNEKKDKQTCLNLCFDF